MKALVYQPSVADPDAAREPMPIVLATIALARVGLAAGSITLEWLPRLEHGSGSERAGAGGRVGSSCRVAHTSNALRPQDHEAGVGT